MRASRLVDNLLGRADIPQVARDRILEAAEGNPLFVEEMLAMLIDDGLLRLEDGAWQAVEDLADVTVPPTIHLLLAARLDRLDAEERGVIERGAVEGKVFHSGAVATLSPQTVRPHVRSRLLALARKELIRPDRAEFAGEDAFRFRHLLTRDAAYQAMPKEQRADLHERFAGWLAEAARERMAEYEEILAYHLEQAFRYRAELSAVDERGRELARRAAEHLYSSAIRADERGDVTAARSLLDRVVELADDQLRARSLLLLSELTPEMGEYPLANETAARAVEAATAVGVAVPLMEDWGKASRFGRIVQTPEGPPEHLRLQLHAHASADIDAQLEQVLNFLDAIDLFAVVSTSNSSKFSNMFNSSRRTRERADFV
jgi:predicted ATPase